ncbi:fungal hydrophobin-domain-containing protein [Coprinopsis sp. MPI-PUGE-AT-0042]|nr:fungal hydrophobin-domain-containing protein [Coprinopsis sp. MPI-PUGE-AT-0042]
MRFNLPFVAAAMALPALVSASPLVARSEGSCNSGTLKCCESVQPTTNSPAATLAGLLGIVPQLTGSFGLHCNSLNVFGAGGNTCSQQTVCCNDTKFNGLIAVGCTPINLQV